MSNVFDYMDWRDIEIEKVEFNEVDNLILSRLAYFPFDGVFNGEEEITIKESYSRYKKLKKKGRILIEGDKDLFPILSNSERFGNLKITKYVNKIDLDEEKQFAAITIILPDDTIYVSYRGTDNTIVGWKEDFNMSFNDLVPAQLDGVEYLNNIAKNYKNKIRVGGHSKGGNIAVYAAAFCKTDVQNRIINVYNNDGPGFSKKVIESEEYNKILDRVHTYIPQSSIIGRLLNHEEKTTILKSEKTGLLQHDLYNWQILGPHFVKSELTNSSEFIDKTITNWLREVDNNQRSIFIDTLFDILNATEAETLAQISSNKVESAKIMVKAYQNLDEETKKIMVKTIKILLYAGRDSLDLKLPLRKNTRRLINL